MASCVQDPRVSCALGCASGVTDSARCQSGPHQQEAERAATWGRWPLLDGVGELCPGPHAVSPGPHYKLVGSARRSVPPRREAGARRRRRVPAEDSSRRRRRALPRAGDGCCRLVVSVTEAEAMALLADNETAQELQHGCGDDCWRSASLAAPLRVLPCGRKMRHLSILPMLCLSNVRRCRATQAEATVDHRSLVVERHALRVARGGKRRPRARGVARSLGDGERAVSPTTATRAHRRKPRVARSFVRSRARSEMPTGGGDADRIHRRAARARRPRPSVDGTRRLSASRARVRR